MVSLDQQILLLLNGSHSLFLDGIMMTLTSAYVWVPLYLSLLFLVVKNNENIPQVMLTVGCALICVAVTAGVTNLLVKPLIARPRPCMDSEIKYLVDVVNGIRLTDYSFFSAHAANTFGIAMFFSLLVRNLSLVVTLLAWSMLNCYTRIYLGYHYPSDIFCGMLFGIMVGTFIYLLYIKCYFLFSQKFNYVSTQYTSTGYSVNNIDVTICVFIFTLIFSAIKSVVIC